TLREAPQAFLRVRVALENGAEAWGTGAEMLSPKWFDKNRELSNEDNFEQLRTSLRLASRLYTSDREWHTAFGLFAKNYQAQISACGEQDLNPLIAGFGPAMLDRAILDALCRLHETSFYDAVRANLPGIKTTDFLPEFSGATLDRFLTNLRPSHSIHARHTVGLVDPISAADQTEESRVGDGLPETLDEVVATYGHTYFKLKVSGKVKDDMDRLCAIAAVLDKSSQPYFVTLDGNEQYHDVEGVEELWQTMENTPALRRLVDSILFIEQPIERKTALQRDLSRLSSKRPVVIDESDSDLEVFPRARHLGYRGVSSKICKGIYKSFINAARCAIWNEQKDGTHYFMTGEDLSTQAGVALQQDLALVSLIGLDHLERNGHHYVKGMSGLPAAEQKAFLTAHPDLYTQTEDLVHVRIRHGKLSIGSLSCPGFAVAAEPDWSAMQEKSLQL
ncbi:mandelate racemase, partial [Acidobacteria bacterium AH-259-O06]|nr:mandelate racemase [Acidobacteria bacterium AH-259-O06]